MIFYSKRSTNSQNNKKPTIRKYKSRRATKCNKCSKTSVYSIKAKSLANILTRKANLEVRASRVTLTSKTPAQASPSVILTLI
jgi:hypothetical protein